MVTTAETSGNQEKKKGENVSKISISQLTDDQALALEIMRSGENIFLTGEAGTGKTTLVEKFIDLSEQEGKQLLVMAPTGTAADNLHGETIHRTFKADIGVQKNNRSLSERKDILKAADIIIIDEISMCRFDLFEYVARRIVYENECRIDDRDKLEKSKFTGYIPEGFDPDSVKENDIQVIVIGDFYQLPPVITQNDAMELSAVYKFDYGKGYAFISPYWKTLNFKRVILKKVIRQENAAFKDILIEVRNDKTSTKSKCIDFLMRNSSDIPLTGDDSIYLIPTNKKCKEVNDREMAKLNEKEVTFYAEIEGDVKDNEKFADDEIVLKKGCKVMTTVNDSGGRYVNGTIGKVTKIIANMLVEIQLSNGELLIIGEVTKEISEPVVEIEKEERLVEEPVFDENGLPKKDDNGRVIFHKVKKIVDVETIVRKKVGTFTQIPLKIAYAITVHKSQGKTFEKINLDPYAWDPGQFYTALSRGKKIENICFLQTIRPKYIMTSPQVKRFMKEIDSQQEQMKNIEFK